MIRYRFNVMEKLKEIGYNSKRLRDEKLLGESYMTQLRRGDLVSWKTIDTLCRLLDCQVGDLVEYVPEDNPEAAEQPCSVFQKEKQFAVYRTQKTRNGSRTPAVTG